MPDSSSSDDEDLSKFASIAVTGETIAKSAEEHSQKAKKRHEDAIARRFATNGVHDQKQNSDEEIEILDAAALKVAKALEQRLEKMLELDFGGEKEHSDQPTEGKEKGKKSKKRKSSSLLETESEQEQDLPPTAATDARLQEGQQQDEDGDDDDDDDDDDAELCLFKGVVIKSQAFATAAAKQHAERNQPQPALPQSAPQIRPSSKKKKATIPPHTNDNQNTSNLLPAEAKLIIKAKTELEEEEEEETELQLDCASVAIDVVQLLAAAATAAAKALPNIAKVNPNSDDENCAGGRAKLRRVKREKEAQAARRAAIRIATRKANREAKAAAEAGDGVAIPMDDA